MARTGRRTGDTDTRDRILFSARRAFARDGYRATIRSIAADAEVDPALVMHYFGNKDRLYAESIEIPLDPAVILAMVHAGPHAEVGKRLAGAFLSVWEDPVIRAPILAVLKGAISGHDKGMAAFREFVTTTMLPSIATEVEAADADIRVELAVAQLVGIVLMRHVMQLEPIASTPIEELSELVGNQIQPLFDQAPSA